MDRLEERATAILAGAAVGDALGGATEGNSPDAIVARYGGRVEGIVPPFAGDEWRTARAIAPYHKGDGHVTDDTLMTAALVEVYDRVRDHLDAYAVADHLVPLLIGERTWIPELEEETILLQRIFLAEKWMVARLHYGHRDPREAGVGNIVNCGAAMYMAPVGIVNAAAPDAAYAEALDLAGAHQSSYGREAAGVYAAAVAESLRPGATVSSVVETALRLAKDGTRAAIQAVTDAAGSVSDPYAAIPMLRAAVEPYDTVGPHYRQPAMDARIPSRTKSIEELPIALGMLVAAGGEYRGAVLGAVNYGRDADSIAVMAGSIAAGLGSAAPEEWVDAVAESSRIDIRAGGSVMASVTEEVWRRDAARAARADDARAALGATVRAGA